MIELGIGLVAFACGFATSAVFAAQAMVERGKAWRSKVESLEKSEKIYQEGFTEIRSELGNALERERKLREAEAKRIAHLRAIASSGGKASAAARKSGGKCK